MNILEGKRLAFIFGSYAALFSLYVMVPSFRAWMWVPALLLTGLFCVKLFFTKKPRSVHAKKIILAVLAALMMVGALFSGIHFVEKTEKRTLSYIGGHHVAEGYITEIHYEAPYGSSYEVRLTALDGRETRMGALLSLPDAGGLSVWDAVSFEGTFSSLEEEYAWYRKADGIWLSAEAARAEKTGVHENAWETFFSELRTNIRVRFSAQMEEDAAMFAAALLTGERDGLEDGLRLAFTRLGISHLLAVSGLHLSIVVGGADALLRLLTVPKKKKNALLICFSLIFASVCGLSPSIVRAATMLSIFYLAELFGERSDSVTSLFFALFAILLFRPHAVYDVGLWLSFLSTFGILCILPILQKPLFPKWHRIPRGLLRFFITSVSMTLAATFFTLPVTYLAFGGVSVISPLTNLLFVPMVQILLYLLVLFAVLGWIPFLGTLLSVASEGLIGAVTALAYALSDLKDIYISLRFPFAGVIVLMLAVGILIVLSIKKCHPAWLFAVFFASSLVFGVSYAVYTHANKNVSYLYLQTDGKSDVLGMVSAGEAVLFDITTGGAAMPQEAYRHLADFYENEIDAYVLTHYHIHHAGTLRKLSAQIKLRRVLLPKPSSEKDEEYCREILSALDPYTEAVFYENGSLSVGNATVCLPERTDLSRSTHPVIAFSAKMGEDGASVTYLSSSATETEVPTGDVVICGSHGPVQKHIFSPSLLDGKTLIVFAERRTAGFTEIDGIGGTIVFADLFDGYIRIAFDG